jgi:hypothetical protein
MQTLLWRILADAFADWFNDRLVLKVRKVLALNGPKKEFAYKLKRAFELMIIDETSRFETG